MKIIDNDTVRHVAHLARLSLDDSELEQYCSQLRTILDYISQLNEVDTSNVVPTSHALSSLKNVFRKDVVIKPLPVERVLQNAPASDGHFFKVPQIIEGK